MPCKPRRRTTDPETARPKTCSICRHRLNAYNTTGICAHGHREKGYPALQTPTPLRTQEPKAEVVKNALPERSDLRMEKISSLAKAILTAICYFYKVDMATLRENGLRGPIAEARQVAIYLLCLDDSGDALSKKAAAEVMHRDLSTIYYSQKQILRYLKRDDALAERIDKIRYLYSLPEEAS